MKTRNPTIINKISAIIKKIIFLFYMDPLSFLTHDPIVRASASTYNPTELQRLGLQITLNLSNKKVRYLGEPTNPIYPDIVIWRPDFPNANTGQAVIVELIENPIFTYHGVETWIRLNNTTGIKINLIVPVLKVNNAKAIMIKNNLNNIHLQTWNYEAGSGRYFFNTVT